LTGGSIAAALTPLLAPDQRVMIGSGGYDVRRASRCSHVGFVRRMPTTSRSVTGQGRWTFDGWGVHRTSALPRHVASHELGVDGRDWPVRRKSGSVAFARCVLPGAGSGAGG
jgi:hypothetical protein